MHPICCHPLITRRHGCCLASRRVLDAHVSILFLFTGCVQQEAYARTKRHVSITVSYSVKGADLGVRWDGLRDVFDVPSIRFSARLPCIAPRPPVG